MLVMMLMMMMMMKMLMMAMMPLACSHRVPARDFVLRSTAL